MNKDFLIEATERYGKAVCVVLWARFAFLLAKRRPLPFLILLAMHAAEYYLKGREVAEENGIGDEEAVANCLAFGFTWWLPLDD